MKKLCVCLSILLSMLLCCSACFTAEVYSPTGEFYIKTSPSNGDTGVSNVISLEADYETYHGNEDIVVTMTVGFGHLPNDSTFKVDGQFTFYVLYRIIEAPWMADKESVWEQRVDYTDSWYHEKYNSTEQKNPPSLLFARYGEFYPIYKENVEFVFPAFVKKGYVQVQLFEVAANMQDALFFSLEFYFYRENGILTLEEKRL